MHFNRKINLDKSGRFPYTWTMKNNTKKAFQQYLNEKNQKENEIIGYNVLRLWKNGPRRGQKTRLYGDYLRTADPVMFEMEYQEWLKKDGGYENETV